MKKLFFYNIFQKMILFKTNFHLSQGRLESYQNEGQKNINFYFNKSAFVVDLFFGV